MTKPDTRKGGCAMTAQTISQDDEYIELLTQHDLLENIAASAAEIRKVARSLNVSEWDDFSCERAAQVAKVLVRLREAMGYLFEEEPQLTPAELFAQAMSGMTEMSDTDAA